MRLSHWVWCAQYRRLIFFEACSLGFNNGEIRLEVHPRLRLRVIRLFSQNLWLTQVVEILLKLHWHGLKRLSNDNARTRHPGRLFANLGLNVNYAFSHLNH